MVYLESVSCFTPTAHLPEVLHFSESHSPASDRARLVVMTEDRPPVTVQPAVVALNVQVPEPRVGTRSYYSTHFLATAQDAARLARSTELKLLQADERRFSLQHRGQVLSSVIHSAAFLEATVGEVLQDARDGHLTEKLADVGGRTICAWAGLWEALDSGGIGNALRYYKAALLAAGKPIFDTGAQPWQDARIYRPGRGTWKTNQRGMDRLRDAHRIHATGRGGLGYIRFLDDFSQVALSNVWTDTLGQNQFGGTKRYVVQTALSVVERCILMTSDPGDLVLDPTCGSGTTALVAERWGRRWITMDTSRVALALARLRLMGARYPYFVLSDSEAGAAAEEHESGQAPLMPESGWGGDIRRGFVYRRALHVMLSTIANCEEIVPGISREDAETAIRRAADYELLYDQPHEDPRVVRVSGPFTVESLSPHTTVDVTRTTSSDGGSFVEMVFDNLAKAGVQNGYRNERLDLGWIEPHAGTWVHAIGGFTDADGTDKTVAISIGPETGTVGREHIAEAAKEAARSVRADLLLVCAYAFDAGAGEQATNETNAEHTFSVDGQRQVGRLRVLNVRINADLMMDDDLKNTGVGNLFTVFGEPDITVTSSVDEDTITVTLNGLDIYDPNKGTIRSSDPEDIACWFIDTNYSGDAFYVRHAYFSGGAADPFDALKKALRAEINAEAWDALYRTESLPFAKPETGKIAVKAINHYGDEALRVFGV